MRSSAGLYDQVQAPMTESWSLSIDLVLFSGHLSVDSVLFFWSLSLDPVLFSGHSVWTLCYFLVI
jgi:hypothetical protein